MTLEKAEHEIEEKAQTLALFAGQNVGSPLGPVQRAHSGGFVREFEHAHIFWHANTGAHEVHGSVRTAYLARGGPGPHPRTGRRQYGYPTSDEATNELGTPVGQFEFGAVHIVAGFGAVGVHGPIARTRIAPDQGSPLTEPIRNAAGTIVFCERGCLFGFGDGSGAVVRGFLDVPGLGRPGLLGLRASRRRPIGLEYRVDGGTWRRILEQQDGPAELRPQQVATRLAGVWQNRLLLRSVAHKALTRPVDVVTHSIETIGEGHFTRIRVKLDVHVPNDVSLPDRTLWDICLRLPDARVHAIAAHAIYSRGDWSSFGFLHATDLHVSRRHETFRTKLKDAGRAASARAMVNPNDSVRALFNYANALHDRGAIDVVVATGDLVDYIFERGDHRRRGGNFRYLERLVLGDASPSDPEGDPNEELRAPLYTVLGNHDYLLNPYELFFEVDLPVVSDRVIRRQHLFNLDDDDAKALQGGRRLKVSTGEAERMIESTRAPDPYYARRFSDVRSYVQKFGDHRLVMLDTGPNADVLTGLGDALEHILGFDNVNERTFVKGVPNSRGSDVSALAAALEEAPVEVVLVVGMHNPPFNPEGNEYAHFFRESERPGIESERLGRLMRAFLSRHQGPPSVQDENTVFPAVRNWDLTQSPHFKHGGIGDLFAFGVAVWPDGVDLLDMFVDPKVDVVLYGHVHERVEFRIRRDGEGFRFFTDFYTENPGHHRESYDWRNRLPPLSDGGLPRLVVVGDQRPIDILVTDRAQAGEAVHTVRDHRPDQTVEFRRRRVPPNPNTLDRASNRRAWWSRHRPLILQTCCLGPADHAQKVPPGVKARESFQGVRALRIERDHIAVIRNVTMRQMRRKETPAGFE